MKAFVSDVFSRAEADLTEAEGGILEVQLPEEKTDALADHLSRRLGSRELRLAFSAAEAAAGQAELVAAGSRLLRIFEEVLGHDAARTYLERPAVHRLTLKALVERTGLGPAKGLSWGLAQRQTSSGHEVYVSYRLRLHSQERTDRLEAVRVRLRPGQEPLPELVPLAEALPPSLFEEWTHRPRKHIEPEQLAGALEAADHLIQGEAQRQGQELRAERQKSLTKDVSRLHAYYAAQIAEQERHRRNKDLALERIEALEEERELRLRELAQASVVRVEVEPLQVLEVETPLALARLELRRKGEPAQADPAGPPRPGLALVFDRASGELTLDPCPACRQRVRSGRLGACAGVHAVHEECLRGCQRCDGQWCQACGEVRSAASERVLCVACRTTCPACEQAVAVDETRSCGRCQRAACAACLATCAACGTEVCGDDRTSAAGDGSAAVFCNQCAVPCPSCKTATPREALVRCGTCGRKFCGGCHPKQASACRLCLGG